MEIRRSAAIGWIDHVGLWCMGCSVAAVTGKGQPAIPMMNCREIMLLLLYRDDD